MILFGNTTGHKTLCQPYGAGWSKHHGARRTGIWFAGTQWGRKDHIDSYYQPYYSLPMPVRCGLTDGSHVRKIFIPLAIFPKSVDFTKKMKVGEQAIYLAQLKGLSRQEAKKRLTDWFERFEIMPWWNKKLEELSKGMQQKVQFVITVLHRPRLLIFDEPFSGFDPVNAELLKREILKLKDEGHTIIFSTHNMASVEEICDHIALINHSKVVLQGAVTDIRSRYKSNQYEPDDAVFETVAEFGCL